MDPIQKLDATFQGYIQSGKLAKLPPEFTHSLLKYAKGLRAGTQRKTITPSEHISPSNSLPIDGWFYHVAGEKVYIFRVHQNVFYPATIVYAGREI
jgi:hypothetical protein